MIYDEDTQVGNTKRKPIQASITSFFLLKWKLSCNPNIAVTTELVLRWFIHLSKILQDMDINLTIKSD